MAGHSEILSIGPTGLDVFVDLARLKTGGTGSGIRLGVGGACRNCAIDLARLGATVTFLTQCYGTIGISREPLPANVRELQLDPTGEMTEWLALFVAAVHDSEVVLSAAAYDTAARIFSGYVAERERQTILSFDTVVVSSDVSYEFWNAVRQRGEARGRQTTCLLTSGLPLPTNYLDWVADCGFFFINADEVAQLGLTPGTFCSEALARGACKVFVTAGREEGAWYASAQSGSPEFRRAPKLANPPLLPIGAGDAFAAGVIQAVSLGMDLRASVDAGLAVATTVLSEGSCVLSRPLDIRASNPASVSRKDA